MLNLSWTLRKRLSSLMTPLQGSVLLLTTRVNFPRSLLENPASHFTVCFKRKTFERLLYDSIFTFFTENSRISKNQSGFKPRDSCNNQPL